MNSKIWKNNKQNHDLSSTKKYSSMQFDEQLTLQDKNQDYQLIIKDKNSMNDEDERNSS